MTFDEMSTAAVHVMDNVHVPQPCFFGCGGIILIKAKEAGFGFSSTGGGGLIFRRNGAEWSNPAACKLSSVGVGAVVGYADKDMVIVLNPFAMNRFMTSNFKLDISVDLGAAIGKIGASGQVQVGVSDKAGVAAALVYVYQQGIIVNAEVTFGGLANYHEANFQMYGTDDVGAILSGKATPQDAAKAKELNEKIEAFAHRTT